MTSYGQITGQLMHVRDALANRQPASPQEQHHLAKTRLHLDIALSHVRQLHHQSRWWKRTD